MTIFDYIQLILLAILIAFGIYYVYSSFFGKEYQPLVWKALVKNGAVSRRLQQLESKYKDKDRFFNFWYQVERLKKQNIQGKFAELGVYKGDTAEILHEMDNERDFFLFDTFSGFQESDLQHEIGKAATYTKHNFADTSVEMVRQRLASEKLRFFVGDFKTTSQEIPETKYALVSMDADLYNPTKSGLEYFFPRLSRGGVIIVHDYNPHWPGIMKAVNEFILSSNALSVPLTDKDNSIMIFKD